jgi:hypothetical protein
MKHRAPAPRFSLSSRSSPLLRADELAHAAYNTVVDGIDLDLAGSSFRQRRLAVGSLVTVDGSVSVWVSPTRPWPDPPIPFLSHVVIDEEKGSTPNGKRQLGAAIQMRERLPESTRIALATRPRNPDGGRGHLSRLSLLRSVAEEWDFDLALDLSGPVDWLWEAEAAVLRLGPRLRLIRVTCPSPALDTHIRSRLTQRTIAAAVDSAFDGVIAVVVPLPFWRWRDVAYFERVGREAVERLSDRFGIVPVRYGWRARERSSAP